MTADRPDVELLADLDAGLLDAPAQVRAAAWADPRSAAVLGALAATRAELAELADPPVPPAVAAQWAAALAAARSASDQASTGAAPGPVDAPSGREPDAPAGPSAAARPSTDSSRPPGPSTVAPARRPWGSHPPPDPDRGRSGGRPSWCRPRPAVVAAVLLVAVLAGAGLLRARSEPLPPVAGVELAAAGRAALGARDLGELADPARRSGCLRSLAAPGIGPDEPVVGGRRVVFDGSPALLLVLGTGELGSFRVVVVDPACGPGGGRLLATERIGR